MSFAVSISVIKKGHIRGLTKRGSAVVYLTQALFLTWYSWHVSEQLINKLDSEMADAEAQEEESWHKMLSYIRMDILTPGSNICGYLYHRFGFFFRLIKERWRF